MSSDEAVGAETPDENAKDAGADIVAIAERGDREAFARLFRLYAPRVKAYLLRLGAAPARAEELAQDTLVAVWRKASYYDPGRASASAWIFTIARNLRIDALRRDRALVAYDIADLPEQADEAPAADERLSTAERGGRVRAAIAALSKDQFEVIRMSFFQDKPHSEIARDLGLPLGTVKSRVRLAMQRLRGALEDLK